MDEGALVKNKSPLSSPPRLLLLPPYSLRVDLFQLDLTKLVYLRFLMLFMKAAPLESTFLGYRIV